MAEIRIVLAGLASLAIAMGIGRFAFTPLLPMMRADGLVSIGEGGFIAAVHFLGYWCGAILAADLPWSARTVLRWSLVVIAVATLATGLTDHLVLWSALRFLTGVCSAFVLVLVSNGHVKYLAEHDRQNLQGWIFSGVGAGIALAGLGTLALMAGGLGSAAGWRIFGVVSLIAAVAISFSAGDEISAGRSQERIAKTASAGLHWNLIIAYGVTGIGYIIPATYLPVMAREIVTSPLLFGWAWPVFGAAAFVSTLLAGRLQRRWSNRHIWSASQAVMAVGLLLPALRPNLAMILVAGVCVGGTFMIITMMGMKESLRVATPDGALRQIAMMTAAFASGQMVGPLLASLLYDLTGSFSPSLMLASAALAVTAVTLLRPVPVLQKR